MLRSLNPSSNRACVAIFTRVVSGSYQSILRVVYGTYPRKMPFLELGMSLAGRRPDGRIHTRQPKVRKLLKSSFMLVASVIGEAVASREGKALWIRRA